MSKTTLLFYVLALAFFFISVPVGLVLLTIAIFLSFKDKNKVGSVVVDKADETKVSKPKKGISVLGAIGILLVIGLFSSVVLTSLNNTKEREGVNSLNNEQLSAVFDVPSLVGKSLSELEVVLGKPSNDKKPPATWIQNSSERTWEKSWSNEGYLLTLSYNYDTKQVIDLFLSADTDTTLEIFRDKNNILRVGNLSENDSRYSLEFVELKAILGTPKSQTQKRYTGVIIKTI